MIEKILIWHTRHHNVRPLCKEDASSPQNTDFCLFKGHGRNQSCQCTFLKQLNRPVHPDYKTYIFLLPAGVTLYSCRSRFKEICLYGFLLQYNEGERSSFLVLIALKNVITVTQLFGKSDWKNSPLKRMLFLFLGWHFLMLCAAQTKFNSPPLYRGGRYLRARFLTIWTNKTQTICVETYH